MGRPVKNLFMSLLILFLAVGLAIAEEASKDGAAPEIRFVDIADQSGAKHRHQARKRILPR